MAHPIIEAQDGLKTILAALPAYSAVDVRDGSPTEDEDVTRDMFWFNDVTDIVDQWRAIGAGKRRTTFRLGFTIETRREGDDERDTRSAALDLLDALEDAVKANPNLGEPAVIQQVEDVTGSFSSAPAGPQMWAARFTGGLLVISRTY